MAVINSITVGEDTFTIGGWGEPGGVGYTPVGTIIAMMANTAPTHYLACDGTIYNIADYVELSDFFEDQFGSKNYFGGDGETTFAVPDLRGEFLRGTGTNSHTSSGNGANVGVHQAPTFIPYFNGGYLTAASASKNSITIGFNSASTSGAYNETVNADSSLSGSGYRKYGSFTADVSSTSTSGYVYKQAIRPTNTSVLFCIATKNLYIENPAFNYSTDEKVVGKWIGGEPLYQKTITYTGGVGTSWGTIATLDSNIAAVVSSDFVSYDPTLNSWLLVNSDQDKYEVFIGFDLTNHVIKIKTDTAWSRSDYVIYMTYRYTKTTD